MEAAQPIGVGMLGLGVVGSGVARALDSQAQTLARRVGAPLDLRKVLVRDLSRPRAVDLPPYLLTQDPDQVLDDPQVQVVLEVMGGESPASDYIRRALRSGKHVVTANKEVMAKEGPELLALADSQGVSLQLEGSVGGAIPIIGSLTRDLLANRINSIHAIINGTTNFILTCIADEGMDGDQALKLAQNLGYAEANPFNDVEGVDAAYKLSILASLAFHTKVRPQQVHREGILDLKPKDFRYARELGYAIKLLAIARRLDDSLEVRVHPVLIPEGHLLAKVSGVYNAVEVEANLLGRVVFHGLGAGAEPTASAVLGDLVDIGRRITSKSRAPWSLQMEERLTVREISDLETRYYFRLNVAEKAGVLAQITRVLGDLNISIASVIQKGSDLERQTAELVITTHPAREADVQRSLSLLKDLEVVTEVNSLIRVEELPS